jgi:hypothetical protein
MKLPGMVRTRGVGDGAVREGRVRASGRAEGKRGLALIGVLLLGGLLAVGPFGIASASAAPAFNQCSSIDNTPGLEVACTVTVTNRLDLGTGIASSTTVARVCRGAAGTTPNGACTTTTSTSGQLVTSVSQCNAAANGGGGNVICSVSIVNNVIGAPRLLGVTVNECIGSGTGGGANPLLCNPVQSTTGATVTQCNGSVNGGGADGRVRCTVTGATSALSVLVNQCNGSVNGGGSTARCAVSFTNNVTRAPAPAPGAVPVPAPTGGTGAGTGSGGAGTGGTESGGVGPDSHGLGGPGGQPGIGDIDTAGSVAPPTAVGGLPGLLVKVLGYTGAEIGSFLVASMLALLTGGVFVSVALWRKRVRAA